MHLQLILLITYFNYITCVLFGSSIVFHKVTVFTNTAFEDRKDTYMASNNIKSIGKSIGVKVSQILFAKVSVLVSAILSVQSIGIVIGNTFCKYR